MHSNPNPNPPGRSRCSTGDRRHTQDQPPSPRNVVRHPFTPEPTSVTVLDTTPSACGHHHHTPPPGVPGRPFCAEDDTRQYATTALAAPTDGVPTARIPHRNRAGRQLPSPDRRRPRVEPHQSGPILHAVRRRRPIPQLHGTKQH
jgi:hypothetical protein